MQEAIRKADVLIEAMGWIRRFRGKMTVIKLGGSVMEDEEALCHVLMDIVFMETVGMCPVVVHGGGAAISRAMAAAGIEPRFIQGRRVTDDATLDIVQAELAGRTNARIADWIQRLDGCAKRLCFETGDNVLFGERLELADADGRPIDLGHVGHVTRVDRDAIDDVCRNEQVPVIPSMCVNEQTGQRLNVNADTATIAVARALGAEKAVFLSDVNGVRLDKDDPETLVHSLTAGQARQMIASGNIASGMIPKVEACLTTLEKGVRKVHIIDGRLRHSLLLEIYTNKGVGTELVQDAP